MAERAQCVITDGRQTEILYTVWGAGALDIDLIAGPDAACRQIRRLYDPTEELREPVWIEAGALIDTSRRLLAVFSWHLSGYAHRAAWKAVLGQTWPGWDLRWAYAGVDDIATAAGVPAAASDHPRPEAALAVLDPADLDDADSLVTVTQPDGSIRAYGIWSDTTDVFWAGPELLDRLSAATPVTVLPDFPKTGLHLDPASRSAVGWTTLEASGLAGGWSRCWPGWRLDFQEDRYDAQPVAIPAPPPTLDSGLAVVARRLTGFRNSAEAAYHSRSPADPQSIEAAIRRAHLAGGEPPRWPGLR
ncbi:hypothetical protein [Actinoplanes sichuanensis]|uniref:Uncharacterized protein n=1 Tax=Actinoplanes sichuanensis TaxID=512349 RepID=A0ABW4AA13_9ACTN|nr:hypothetical protein [Actinoplanes sichuanensis]